MSTVRDDRSASKRGSFQAKRSLKTFIGKTVSIKGDTLVMQDQEGRSYSHTLAKNVRVTCDGTACVAEQLKIGSTIRITLRQREDDEARVTRVESLDKEMEFAKHI